MRFEQSVRSLCISQRCCCCSCCCVVGGTVLLWFGLCLYVWIFSVGLELRVSCATAAQQHQRRQRRRRQDSLLALFFAETGYMGTQSKHAARRIVENHGCRACAVLCACAQHCLLPVQYNTHANTTHIFCFVCILDKTQSTRYI